ncbi:MAG: Hsp20/alpha crystallin family protein [Bacillaceae bacterium]|nr:Hsp20/alpha crystallin family protein [Bacillaceae bacterium]
MSLLPYEPFRRLEKMKKELDQFFSTDFPSLSFAEEFQPIFGTPKIDVVETDREVVARCDLPGLENKDDVTIEVDQQTLTISGQINKVQEFKEENMFRQERYSGKFHRTVPLPARVSSEGIKATYKRGILEVRMPKTNKSQKSTIDIEFH